MAVLFPPAASHSLGAVFPFDEESAFCIYFKMSRGDISDQDLEDLCITLGKPTYTPFKPSEMFTKKSHTALKRTLFERIRYFEKDTMFRWRIEASGLTGDPEKDMRQVKRRLRDLPHPTPYIRAEIVDKGRGALGAHAVSLVRKVLSQDATGGRGRDLTLDIYLKPEKIVYRFNSRNIALEDVQFPHRFILLRPLRVELIQPKSPGNVIARRDIP
jgi:hypothetical protein